MPFNCFDYCVTLEAIVSLTVSVGSPSSVATKLFTVEAVTSEHK